MLLVRETSASFCCKYRYHARGTFDCQCIVCRLIAGGHSHHADINLKGAILHVFGDTIQAIGVAIAAALIWAHQVQHTTSAIEMYNMLASM